MLPGMGSFDPKQMGALMRQMGIKSEEVNATRVIIEKEGGKIIIEQPQVTKISMKGESSYQIAGAAREESQISSDDIKMVAEQAGASEDEAKEALEGSGGDIAEAIVKLQEKKQ
ncbi:MAG: nascent polypeptide-associated complex protein [Candidatus Micrarchaeota archaeon]